MSNFQNVIVALVMVGLFASVPAVHAQTTSPAPATQPAAKEIPEYEELFPSIYDFLVEGHGIYLGSITKKKSLFAPGNKMEMGVAQVKVTATLLGKPYKQFTVNFMRFRGDDNEFESNWPKNVLNKNGTPACFIVHEKILNKSIENFSGEPWVIEAATSSGTPKWDWIKTIAKLHQTYGNRNKLQQREADLASALTNPSRQVRFYCAQALLKEFMDGDHPQAVQALATYVSEPDMKKRDDLATSYIKQSLYGRTTVKMNSLAVRKNGMRIWVLGAIANPTENGSLYCMVDLACVLKGISYGESSLGLKKEITPEIAKQRENLAPGDKIPATDILTPDEIASLRAALKIMESDKQFGFCAEFVRQWLDASSPQ